MSQVRKLLQGNLIPKAEQGYKFHLDSQDIYLTDQDLTEIDQQFAQLPMERRQFLANTTNAIKGGDLSGSRTGNLIDMRALTGLSEKELDYLRERKSSYIESALPKKTYYTKQAINDALNIIYATWRKNHSSKETTAPQKVDKSTINLDFNEDNGKKYLSPTAEQNLNARKRISDLLNYLQTGDDSTYDYSAYNTDAISSWLNGLEGDDKYKAGSDYFTNLWTEMGNKSGYAYDPDVEDLLSLFGINYGLTASVGNVGNVGSVGSEGSTTGSGSVGSGTVTSGTSGASGVTGASTGNTKVGDIITVLNKDYKVVGFKDNGDPILEEIVNSVENNENQTEAKTEQQEVNSNWNPEIIEYAGPMTGIGPKHGLTYTPTKRSLELMEVGTVTLPFDRWGRLTGRVKQRLMKDINGTLYSIGDDGIICFINSDYVKDILAGKQITYNDWHKNTKVFVRSRKEGGVISKSKTDSFKSKFKNVIKGQNGIDPNWKVPGWQIEEPTPAWKQGSLYPEGTEPKVGYDTTVPGVLGMDDFDPTNGVTIADMVTKRKPDLGGGATQPISDKSKLLIPTISAIGAISNLFQSKRYADKEEQKINSGRYNLLSQPVDLMSYYNPIFERRRQEINNRRMSGLLGSPTNDWTQYNAGLNQLQSQLDTQLGELTTQEGQDRFTRDQTNIGLRNQKYGLDTNVANENRKINSSFNMASYDPELSKMLRNWQTKENFRTQILNTINKDQNTIYGYKQNAFNMQQSREFDSWLRNNFANEVAAYNQLDYNQRAQYMDLEDYIERTNPNASEAIRIQKQLMQERYLEWLYRNGTTFNYSALTGRSSPSTDALAYRKKGGTLRGKTRYTMEPDERIWIDNNKAAHNAVAKLSENTIKLLLRALK